MRRFPVKILAFLLPFVLGAAVDYELRHRRSGIADCTCASFKCRVTTLTDNPNILANHPVESIEMVISAAYYD